jgi:hypothetical protein
MASSSISNVQAANYIPELWALGATDAVEFRAVIAKRVNREFEGEIASMGDTVNIPSMSNFTANDKSANTDVDFENMVHPTQALSINKHKYVAVKLERFMERQAMPEYRGKVTQRLGYPLARAMETDLSALFDGFTTNGTIGTAGVELTDDDYLSAWTKLMEAGAIEEAMIDNDTSIFLSPAAAAGALKIEKFVSRDFGAREDAVSKAALGAIYGSHSFVSNLLESDATGQHDCAWIHKDVLTLAVQQKVRVESDYRPASIATEMVADVIYGLKELTRPGESNANVTLTDNFGVFLATV